MTFVAQYLEEVGQVAAALDQADIKQLVDWLVRIRKWEGRLFVLGVGGSAANASHAVNDFRLLAGLDAYAPTDNVSELTARINDHGWEHAYAGWLRTSRLDALDGILIFSVGGGDMKRHISLPLVRAVKYAKSVDATILGILGRDGGVTAKIANACVIIPPIYPDRITPHTEAFQAVLWHLLVSHPRLRR